MHAHELSRRKETSDLFEYLFCSCHAFFRHNDRMSHRGYFHRSDLKEQSDRRAFFWNNFVKIQVTTRK